MKYVINYIHCLMNEETYADGFTGDTLSTDYRHRLSADTREGIIQALAHHLGAEPSTIEINPCGDDPSRMDVSRLEQYDGTPPSKSMIKEWEEGKARLWLASYTVYVVIESPADMGG
jgi:hypothetical protein